MPEDLAAQGIINQEDGARNALPGWLALAILLGLYLTLRGYHSRDGDQAYRLPLLLHQQAPALYRDDPFVRAFDQFNPHRGAFLVLDLFARPLGLSAGLLILFVLTFAITRVGVDRLARCVWPRAGGSVGLLAFVLVLIAKAGNIGTNHLFESMLLDRLQAFALGWVAIAASVSFEQGRRWIAPAALGLATLIHPSAGLQLALGLSGSWIVWAVAGRWTKVGIREATVNAAVLGLAVLPGLLVNGRSPARLLDGLTPDEYWTLAVELQSPQHMLPHLWRFPQWLAWGAYFVLAAIAVFEMRRTKPISEVAEAVDEPVARIRLILTLGVILSGLAMAWFGIEVLRDVRVTVFQPFRMATIARGIALMLISGYVLELWRSRNLLNWVRSALIVVGLMGDWLMVVVTAFELTAFGIGFVRAKMRLDSTRVLDWVQIGMATMVLAWGLQFLSRHDTESGHVPLLMTLGAICLLAVPRIRARIETLGTNWVRSRKKASILAGAAWIVPVLAFLAALIPANHPLARRAEVHALVGRCRFLETPDDDIERLAAWCRENTPESARFVGPPGPKTFRLWSRRSLAFNRASSPYHATGLADWFSRFRDHVDFDGSAEEFVRQYVRNRHGIESRYQGLSPLERTQLAVRQGATHVIAAAPSANERAGRDEGLELLHVEGRYAVYRVSPDATVALGKSGIVPR